ncbi:MAG: MerR family transcriptional regulator [Rhodospirillales bacterium]|nr:MerR family transcriptional regulator [Rhodospirillales bacterium]
MEPSYSISELSNEFGVTNRTIRYYESIGILIPKRNGQKRIYSSSDRVTLELILRGKRLGFSLSESKEIIDLYSASQGEERQLKLLINKLNDKRLELLEKRKDLNTALATMDSYSAKCRQRLKELESEK